MLLRCVLVVLGTASYLGLAVAGMGGFTAFFSHPPLIALTVLLFGFAIVALFAGGNLSPGVREDRGNRWVLWVFSVLGLAGGTFRRGAIVMGFGCSTATLCAGPAC